jgi:hypothetical protein
MPVPGRPRHALTIALLAAVALAPGCGGGGGDDGTLTKAEFVAKADQICKQAREKFLAAQPGPPSNPQQAAALQGVLIGTSENELSEIRSLDAPADVKPALDRYLRAREEGIALLKKGLKAAQNEDLPAYTAAQRQIAADQVKRLHLAQAVGFTECSRPGGSSSGG